MLRVHLPSQSTAEHVDSVTGEHKQQQDEQNRDQQNLFETSTQFVHDTPHVRHQRKDAQRADTAQNVQQLFFGSRTNFVRHPKQKQQRDGKYEQIHDSAGIFDQRLRSEQQTIGQRFQDQFETHANDEHVLHDLKRRVIHDSIIRGFEQHRNARHCRDDDHDPI